MKVADLRKYRKNIESLEAINRLLEDRQITDSVQASRGAPDYALTHRKVEGLTKSKGTIELLNAKNAIIREQAAIRMFINGIKERRIYEALNLYCMSTDFHNPTWEDVAEVMKEDNAHALRVAVERHLEKFFKNVRLCS